MALGQGFYLREHRRLGNFVMSSSPLDFTSFPGGACPPLPALQGVDSQRAKVESETCGKPSPQENWLGLFGEALRHTLSWEAYRELRFLPGGSAVTPL